LPVIRLTVIYMHMPTYSYPNGYSNYTYMHTHILTTYTHCTYTYRYIREEIPEEFRGCYRTNIRSIVPWEWWVRKAQQMEIKRKYKYILWCDVILPDEWLLTLRRNVLHPSATYSEAGGNIFLPSLYPEDGFVWHGLINCCWSLPAQSFLFLCPARHWRLGHNIAQKRH
jgi:hypothetical protein